jgi:hypothetical protein
MRLLLSRPIGERRRARSIAVLATALLFAGPAPQAVAEISPEVATAIETVLAALTPSPDTTATPTPTGTLTPTATATPAGSATATGTATPTRTATPTATQTPNAAATAVPTQGAVATPTVIANVTPQPGGSITIVSRADVHGLDGDTVDAGRFRINNTTDSTELVRSVRLQATNSSMLSEMTLSAGGQSVTISGPGEDNTFTFDPGFEVPPNGSTDATLTVTIESSGSSSSSATATPESTTTASPTPTETPILNGNFSLSSNGGSGSAHPPLSHGQVGGGSGLPGPTAFAMVAVALACVVWRRSRRGGFVLAVVLFALYAGCGSEETTTQTVNGITAANAEGPVTMTGLPGSLGNVSRPDPLVFPGAKIS